MLRLLRHGGRGVAGSRGLCEPSCISAASQLHPNCISNAPQKLRLNCISTHFLPPRRLSLELKSPPSHFFMQLYLARTGVPVLSRILFGDELFFDFVLCLCVFISSVLSETISHSCPVLCRDVRHRNRV